jgi:hypothetical protein
VIAVAATGVFGLPAAAAAAPTPTTVGPNVNVTRRAGNQTEGTVAVDPANTQRVFVASNDESLGLAGVFTARSTDGGQTWTALNVGTGTGAGGDGFAAACCDPSASWDNFGNLFLVYLAIGPPRQVVLLVSTNGGQAFNQVAVLDNVGTLDQPTVATGAGSVWVTWRNGASSISVRGAAVTGLGTANIGAFGAVQVPPNSNGGNFGDVAIGPAGQVMVTYQIPTGGQGPATIFTNVDADGVGAGAFGARQTATTTNVGGFDFIPAQPDRSIDAEAGLVYDRSGGVNNGRVYLVYTDETPDESGNTNILVRSSNDNGTNWTAPVRVNDDTGANSQFLPRISLDQSTGNLAVTWHDARNDTETGNDGPNNDAQFWGAFSLDGGATFTPNVQISAGTSDEDGAEPPAAGVVDIDYGDYAGNSFAGGRLHAFWADNSNSTGDNPNGTLNRFDMYTALVTPPVANMAPTVDAGPAVAGTEGSPIALDGTVTDPDDAHPATTWTITPGPGVDPGATCTFANPTAVDTTVTCTDDGTYTATLTANDGFAPPVSDSTTVTVANAPPLVHITSPVNGALFQLADTVAVTAPFTDPGANDTHTCTINWGDGIVAAGTVAAGVCTGSHTYAAGGVKTITVTVTDDDGGSGSASVRIDINRPPDCSTVVASPNRLWPPNHTLHLVTISGATDPDGDPVTLTITGITQDEPVNAPGSGNTAPDAFLVPGHPDQAQIRAERAGPGDGRVYRIAFTATDGRGGTCTGVVTVQVPKSNNGTPAVDSAPPSFNSLLP